MSIYFIVKGGASMVKRQHISYYADEQESKDFEAIKEAFERRTNSDTIRAMIRFCKKNLPQIIAVPIKTAQPPIN